MVIGHSVTIIVNNRLRLFLCSDLVFVTRITRSVCLSLNFKDNGGCGQYCKNTPGSFNCTCGDNFEVNKDGRSCDGKTMHTYSRLFRVSRKDAFCHSFNH